MALKGNLFRLTLAFLLPYFWMQIVNAQNPQWENFTCGTPIRNVIEEGNILWVSTQGGLVKLDKTTGIPIYYNVTNSDLPGTNTGPVIIDGSGNKWIGTASGGMAKFDGTNWTIYNTSNSGLPDPNVSSIVMDGSGTKWIGTYGGGMAKFDGTNWVIYDILNSGLPVNTIRTLAIDGNGAKWIGTYYGGLAKYDGTNWIIYNTSNSGIPNNLILDIAIDDNGIIWVCTGGGLSKFDGTNWTTYNTSNSGLPSTMVSSIAFDEAGTKWIGTGNGLAKFDGNTWTVYNTSNSGLPNNTVYEIFCGANGLKWVGTYRGLAKFDGTTWTQFETSNSGLTGNTVYSIVIDGDGAKWFGSENGIAKFDGTSWTTFYTPNSGLPTDAVTSIAIDANSTKWLGIQNTGLIKFDGTNWTMYNSSNSGLPDNTVFSIVLDEIGTKWIGTHGGLANFDGTNWSVYNNSNSGLPNNHVSSIAIDSYGFKWIGTWGGLAKFDGTNWTIYNNSNSGLPENMITSVAIDDNGIIWVGTYNSGIVKFDGNTWTVYNTSNSGLPDNYITSLFLDGSGSKWIGTYSGEAVFDGTNWITYTVSNSGIPSNYVYSVAFEGGLKKWIGTVDGGVVGYEDSQASNIVFSDIQSNSANINWEDGFGSKRVVFVKQILSGSATPVNNTTYTANTSFGSGSQIGTTGWYCVFNGTTHSSGVTVSNLTPTATYRVMVCEYTGAPGSEQYNINIATGNPANYTSVANYTVITSSNPTSGGNTTGAGVYTQGTQVTVTASANAGWTFINWAENGNIVSTTESYTFILIDNRNLVSNFNPPQYTISTSSNPTNGGTTTGGGIYTQGSQVTVTASPNTNWIFVNWTENGNIVSTDSSYTFTVTANKNLIANFIVQQFTITTSSNPTNGGSTSGGSVYNPGVVATVIASTNPGWNFLSWIENGSTVSTSASYSFTVTGNRNLVAVFLIQQYTITVSSYPTNGGTTSGGGVYNFGDIAWINATANNNYTFLNWTENGNVVSTSPQYAFSVTQDRTLEANFTQIPTYQVTTSSSPGNGGVTSGEGNYINGQTATVTAISNTGYNFIQWTENGTIVSVDSVYTFVVIANRNLVAIFELQQFSITTASIPTGSGSTNGGGLYPYGATATVTASSGKSWVFYEWNENCNFMSNNPTYSFIVNSDRVLDAVFYQPGIQYVASTIASPLEGGYVTGCGTYNANSQATLNANPYTSWRFLNWTEGGIVISTNSQYSYTVLDHRNLTANFVTLFNESAKFDKNTVHIFPNPTRDRLFLEWVNSLDPIFDKMTLINTLSQEVLNLAIIPASDRLSIDVKGFTPGIYFLILSQKGQKVVDFKIVVQP